MKIHIPCSPATKNYSERFPGLIDCVHAIVNVCDTPELTFEYADLGKPSFWFPINETQRSEWAMTAAPQTPACKPTGQRGWHWLESVVRTLCDWLSWYCWRRWRIYCPSKDVSHLFDKKAQFENSLFDYDEAFVSPCTFNEVNCGGIKGKWTPKIKMLSMEMPDES